MNCKQGHEHGTTGAALACNRTHHKPSGSGYRLTQNE